MDKQAILIRKGNSVAELSIWQSLDGWHVMPSVYRQPVFADRIFRNFFVKNEYGIDVSRRFTSYDCAFDMAKSIAISIKKDYGASVDIDDDIYIRYDLNAVLMSTQP